jgi:hypothetical protein
MVTQAQVKKFIASHPEPRRSDMEALHRLALKIMPGCKLWLLDGKDETGKAVTNPNVGYGSFEIKYAGGATREFYQVGFSPNTTGLSVYIMGIKDRKYLPKAYGKSIGKASVTGYCIKFKALSDIDLDVLEDAMRYGVKASGGK